MESDPTYVYLTEDAISDTLICSICCNPFVDPVEHFPVGSAACSQIYCMKCVSSLTQCPHCRNEVKWKNVEITPLTQRFLFKPLSELEVVCPECKKPTPRGEFKTHWCGCPKVCINGCGVQFPPNQQAKHDEICPAKTIPCAGAPFGCKWLSPRRTYESHSSVCPFVAILPVLMDFKQRIEILEKRANWEPYPPYPCIPKDNEIIPLQFRGINGYADQLGSALFCWRWFPRGTDKFRVVTIENGPDKLPPVDASIRPRDLAGVSDYRDSICDTFFCWRWMERNSVSFRVVTLESGPYNAHHEGAASIHPRHLKGINGYHTDEIANLKFSWRQFKKDTYTFKVLTIE